MNPAAPQTLPAPEVDAMLAEMAREGRQAAAPSASEVSEATLAMRRRVIAQAAGGWQSARDGVKHLRYTHEDCVDMVLASPGISQNDLAMRYGVTPAWMSIVMNCDAFKAKLAERRAELIDPVLAASLNERFAALAQRSVEVLLEKLSQPAEKIPDKLALEAAALGAKSVGLGVPQPSGAPDAAAHLAAVAHRLIDLNRPKGEVIEGQTREVDD